MDTGKPEVQNVIANMVQGEMNRGRVINFQDGNLDTDTALIYDAILSFSLALHELSRIQVRGNRHSERFQLDTLMALVEIEWNPLNLGHSTDAIRLSGRHFLEPWIFNNQLHEIGRVHGLERQDHVRCSRFANELLFGRSWAPKNGARKYWYVLQNSHGLVSGLVTELFAFGVSGTWNQEQGLNLTRVVEVTEIQNPNNIMANKTFVVALLKAPPYTMLKEEVCEVMKRLDCPYKSNKLVLIWFQTQKLEGNDRFEGFAVDLMNAISQLLHFNVTYKVVADGRHGSMDLHGNWDGAMQEVIKGTEEDGADFAVADLSITSVRATAVDFSMPWMNLGKAPRHTTQGIRDRELAKFEHQHPAFRDLHHLHQA